MIPTLNQARCEEPIACCDTPPTIETALASRIKALERDLQEAKEALDAVQKNPEVITLLDLIRRVQRRL